MKNMSTLKVLVGAEEGELVEMIVYKSRLPQLVYKEDFSVENLAEKVSEFAETLLEKDALLAGPPDPDLEAAKFWLTLRDSDGEARGRLETARLGANHEAAVVRAQHRRPDLLVV